MAMRSFKLNPITQKRLRRFTALRRAYCSFWMLIGLYLLSLISELISNDKPLFVRFEGDFFFPVLAYYPDDVFTGSGLQSRPDYKEIAASEAFRSSGKNYMVFPPIPYGPYETLRPEDIDADDSVRVAIEREQRVASLNVDASLSISRSLGWSLFFGGEDERVWRGASLERFLAPSAALKEAISRRMANESDAPEFYEKVVLENGIRASLSLSEQSVRPRPPTSIRLTIREEVDVSSRINLVFQQGILAEDKPFFETLAEPIRSRIIEGAERRAVTIVEPLDFERDGVRYQARFEKEDVRFPFRPVSGHWLGLDSSGRDVFSRILYGLRISLNFGIALVAGTMAIGVIVGGLQGYRGGKTDLLGQRFIEIWESLPFLYIMIFMGSVFGQSFLLLLVVYGLFNWIGISYYMRGEFLKLRKQPFVEAAHCLGLSDRAVMFKHILPNALVPLITFFPFSLVGAIFSLSALDFLGFGLPPPTPSWGELLSQAQEFKRAWWLVVYPSLTLFVVILLSVFVGEGIRAAFDPRVNSRYES